MYPYTTLDNVDIAINTVATYYNVDPERVERWPITRFSRREEYMLMRLEIKRQINNG